jgi:hypothetical protein
MGQQAQTYQSQLQDAQWQIEALQYQKQHHSKIANPLSIVFR